MPARVEFSARQRLQGIGHVDQSTSRFWFNKGPSFCLGILQPVAPLVAEEQRQGAAVGVGVVRPVGTFISHGFVDELEAGIAGLVVTMAILKAARTLQLESVRQASKHRNVGEVAERGELLKQLGMIVKEFGKSK